MRPIIGVLITILALWAWDAEMNNSKYTLAARQMVSSITGGRLQVASKETAPARGRAGPVESGDYADTNGTFA